MSFNFTCCPGLKLSFRRKEKIKKMNEITIRNDIDERDVIRLNGMDFIELPDDFQFNETLSVFVHDIQDRYICLYTKTESHFFRDINPVTKHVTDILPHKFSKQLIDMLKEVKMSKKNKQFIFFSEVYKVLDIIPIIVNDEVKGTVVLERQQKYLNRN
jgi:hypothetical protein